MEALPVEVIGNILSRLGAARDVVIAAATCRKWREACRNHLHTLRFSSDDWPMYRDLTSSRLEILITQAIFQTTGLQCLSISMDEVVTFSPAPVIAWLLYTRETLRSLSYTVRTSPSFSILERCGRQKLEALFLAHNAVMAVEPSYQRFPSLKSISFSSVSISALDLSLLLSACPKLESLALISPEIAPDSLAAMELSSPTLKSIYVEAVSLDRFLLEADCLELLHLKDSTLELFEFAGKGTLKQLKIDDLSVMHLDIGDNVERLEVVDVSNFTMVWPKFYQMICKSSGLRKLRLWGIIFDDEDDAVDIETIAGFFPSLRELSLSFDLREGLLQEGLQGATQLGSLAVLELGWNVITDQFGQWVAGMLGRCPELKKLVVHGVVSEAKTHEECQTLADFTSFMVSLMRKYMHIDVRFEYE
ncbi:unnamed protein product [Spirodela intermedia]|uniref:F-box domain-containing protein n=1 Tax=Spirodela intermedia TaxID=51605 RepID=A0A7I8L5S2_SPIIN|nr:unnamed protein product [Spirodela intermedia]